MTDIIYLSNFAIYLFIYEKMTLVVH